MIMVKTNFFIDLFFCFHYYFVIVFKGKSFGFVFDVIKNDIYFKQNQNFI